MDKVTFIAEMLGLLEKTGNVDAETLAIAGSTLADLKVEEGKAKGALVTTRVGKEYRQRIEFRQIDGSWLVHSISDAVEMAGDQGDQNGDSRSAEVARSGECCTTSGFSVATP